MAGGLFGQPFVLNVKCIIFSLVIIGIFLINPTSIIKNKMVLLPVDFWLSLFSLYLYVQMEVTPAAQCRKETCR